MKTIKTIITTLVVSAFTLIAVSAQNYKAPKIDASGKMYNSEGKHVGSVNEKGEIMDHMGTKIASVDGNGILIDAKTGKKLGKAEKNGNYVSYSSATKDGNDLTVSAPANGTCLVKNKDGKVVMEVHENYKMYGTCAAHCLENHMDHSKTLDKSKDSKMAAYVCPMHADMTSDKAGKCPKCGMDMEKK